MTTTPTQVRTTGYQNFIFDLYGTLVDIHTDEDQARFWAQMGMFFRYNGADWTDADLRAAYKGAITVQLDAQRKVTSWPDAPVEDVFADLYRAKGLEPTKELLSQTAKVFRLGSTDYLFLYPGTLEVLDALRAQGKGVYLLSNAQGGFTRPELASLNLTQRFDHIYISSERGRHKPDPIFLQDLMAQCGIDPSSAIMTGNDLTTDVEVARSCGIASAYLHTNHSKEEWLSLAPQRATHVITNGRIEYLLSLV